MIQAHKTDTQVNLIPPAEMKQGRVATSITLAPITSKPTKTSSLRQMSAACLHEQLTICNNLLPFLYLLPLVRYQRVFLMDIIEQRSLEKKERLQCLPVVKRFAVTDSAEVVWIRINLQKPNLSKVKMHLWILDFQEMYPYKFIHKCHETSHSYNWWLNSTSSCTHTSKHDSKS